MDSALFYLTYFRSPKWPTLVLDFAGCYHIAKRNINWKLKSSSNNNKECGSHCWQLATWKLQLATCLEQDCNLLAAATAEGGGLSQQCGSHPYINLASNLQLATQPGNLQLANWTGNFQLGLSTCIEQDWSCSIRLGTCLPRAAEALGEGEDSDLYT